MDDRHKVGIYTKNRVELYNAMNKIIQGNIEFHNLRQYAISHYSWEYISKNTRLDYEKLLLAYKKEYLKLI